MANVNAAAAEVVVVDKVKEEEEEEAEEATVMCEVIDGKWTCSLCNVTIHVRSDGRAREQHLSGKAHARKARALAAAAAPPPSDNKEALRFECRLCGCSVASSAREAHVGGAKHLERMAALRALCKGDRFKRGDWLCCSRKHTLQHNFANAATCRRSLCSGARELGLAYEEAMQLARAT